MAGVTSITIVGVLGGDPEVRQVGNNTVVNMSVAVTERVFDRDANEFVDKGTSWFPCSAWKDLGEHVAGSLSKGDRVIVTGSWKERTWEKDGETRRAWQLEVEDIGPSLRFATAAVTRVGGGNRQQQNRGAAPRTQGDAGGGRRPVQPAQPSGQQAWAAPGAYDDETPF